MMSSSIPLKASVELGVLPTHIKFVGGLVPDDAGKLPRDAKGVLLAVAEMAALVAASPVTITSVQMPVFPGVDSEDTDTLMCGLKDLGLTVHLILMVGGVDPMEPSDEDAVVAMLVASLTVAKKYAVENVSSTSIEEWMQPGAKPKSGAAFDAAVAQNVKVHLRAYEEAGVADSAIRAWHIEFLRKGEFQTFTDMARAWMQVKAMNEAMGHSFFKVLVDAAHSGDSALSIPENEAVIAEVAAAGGFGMFHASAKTTRGCLSTDDGWIGALLAAAAKTGKLESVFVELFHHDDAALVGLRELDSGHGIDTTDGRSYREVVVDGLVTVTRRLNNLVARGVL